ncbi:hypothetical protein [Micromonospora echinofusca]|uniref:hypothetical protein n=1 Tax=Micromonospora echinofusca TaxID=47858 RepID=UPI001FCC24B4|nr:hypothetical protein [Micromonospora echinofusca]
MAPPLARNAVEAHLHLALHPCPCGETEFGATSSVRAAGGDRLVRYAGRCVSCGRDRAVEFRLPAEPTVPADGDWADGPEPSELIDAGQWRWLADRYGDLPVDLDGYSGPAREQARADLSAARAALDEVLKFLPDGADEVPESAFWSPLGRQVRADEPGRFRRVRLLAARDGYDRLLARLDGPGTPGARGHQDSGHGGWGSAG